MKLPVIGSIRTHESTRKLARRVEAGTARIRSATLSHQRGRWHVAFSVELDEPIRERRSAKAAIGIDLGIKTLAVLSTGEHISNPRRLTAAMHDLRRAQRTWSRRRGPKSQSGAMPSARYLAAAARVQAAYTRVANLRRNDAHKLTSRLVREFDTLVIEDLYVAGMVRNRRLARHIAEAGWGEIRRQLTYKAEWAGVRLIVADRWFASSKTCSKCGTAKAKLALSERTYVCTACGLVLDRDVNAARNLAALAETQDTGELRREQPDGTDVRPATTEATGPPREGSSTQRHRREVMTRRAESSPNGTHRLGMRQPMSRNDPQKISDLRC